MSTFVEPYPGYASESRVGTVIGTTSFLLCLAATVVGLRIYTRAFIIRQMGPDDWAAIIAFSLVFACGFCVAYNVNYGFGKHQNTLTPDQIVLYLRCFYVSIVFYNCALLGIKVTFLIQYYRVLATTRLWKRIFAVMMVIIGSWSLSQVFVQTFICSPIRRFWEVFNPPEGTCIPNDPQWYINAAGNIVTDVAILVLPLPTLWALKLHMNQKLVLVGIFCLGFFTVAVSIVRIKFLKLSADGTWDNVEAAAWSVSELCSGIICASLPTLRPLLARFIPSMGSQAGPSKASQGYYLRTGDERSATGDTLNRSINASRNRPVEGEDVELGEGRYLPHNNRRRASEMDIYGLPNALSEKHVQHAGSHELVSDAGSSEEGRKSGTEDDEQAIMGLRRSNVGVTTEIGVGVARPDRSHRVSGYGIRIERDVVQTKTLQ